MQGSIVTGTNSLMVNREPGFNIHTDSAFASSLKGVHAHYGIELSVHFLRVIVARMHTR